MEKYLMALDQGTTSSRCIIFDKKGNIKASAAKEFRQIFPANGWVEQDPNEIWSSQYGVMMEAYALAGIDGSRIASIGITNQRETTIIWDRKTGEPVYNAIVWQCRRTADYIEELKANGYGDMLRKKTGLIPDPYFSGTKIKWILDNVPGARERAEAGKLMFGTVDTWLLYRLTKGRVHATDLTNASRTMLFNINTLEWDKEILELLDIPSSLLPEVYESSHVFGTTDPSVFGTPVPIGGIAGDQQAALFGQCCFEPGDTKNTYGTGCFLLMNTGKNAVESESGLLTTIAANPLPSPDGRPKSAVYALEGSVFVAGAAVKWLRDDMQLVRTAEETETVAKSVPDTGGVYVVPAFTGLGAPYWDAYARGAVFGLTRATTAAHFVRAVLESLAYQSLDVIRAMEKDSGITLSELRVDGGASANDFLLQFQSDILGAAILKPSVTESTALGAAYLAGLSTGVYSDTAEIKENWKLAKRFDPEMDEITREKSVAGWKDAVGRTLTR